MQRRTFLASSLAVSALAAGGSSGVLEGAANAPQAAGREYYELRRYHFQSGPQMKPANDYFRAALIPALNRLGIAPVGVLNGVIGPENPSVYVLMPTPSLDTLVNIEARLAQDAAYQDAGRLFLSAPAESPAFVRMESKLMIAFEGRPKLAVPPATSQHGSRAFELRTYESPSVRDHIRKLEMFRHGEFDIFTQAGFWPVFYGDTLIGSRLPNLTYMLAFNSLDDRDKLWNAFRSSPAWKKLSTAPRYAFEQIVSNITNVILSPASYSQI